MLLQQHHTGRTTEQRVAEQLMNHGLVAIKPRHDVGIDIEAHDPASPSRIVRIQVKGRGAVQSNECYRWFQVRTTPAQRAQALADGLPVSEAYRKKVALCDFFVLVAQRFDEFWVFPRHEIIEIAEFNALLPGRGGRKDNREGKQRELDLDIKVDGIPLVDHYAHRRNNFSPIVQFLAASA